MEGEEGRKGRKEEKKERVSDAQRCGPTSRINKVVYYESIK
jgi:hypothetical protein